jgi:Fe-S cluster assembly ATP-binding protein
MQYPIEVPGVPLVDALSAAAEARGDDASGMGERVVEEAGRTGLATALLARSLNTDLSGGETKRTEILQLGVIAPKIAVLDEIDSGLDVDALRQVSQRVEILTHEAGLGVLAITHYSRLLRELRPDVVSVLRQGRIVAEGGAELAEELERTGYAGYDDGQAVGGS